MNEQMESYYVKVIEQLAQKLGTTTEYLWQVLVNQAYIDGIIGIIYIILTILAGYGLYRLHKYFSSSDNGCRTCSVGNCYTNSGFQHRKYYHCICSS